MKDSIEISRKKYIRKRIMEHLLGPFGSILFHILIVILAFKFLGMVTEERAAEIKVQIVEADAIDLEEFEKELEEMQELQDMQDLITPPDQIMDQTPPDVTEVAPQEDITMDLNDLNVLSDAQSPLIMKGLMAGRSASGRNRMLGAAGRWGKITEQSVVKALQWLKNNQEADGCWKAATGGEQGKKMKIGITGVCLLAFLAHGETPSSAEYGATVEKAIKYLVEQQWDDGHFVETNDPQNVPYKAGTYGQAIATYALSEAYALTRIPTLKPVMEKAVDVILKGQQSGGMWFYRYEKGDVANNSVSGWHMQALKAAHMAGAENPGLKEAMKKAIEKLKTRQAENGRFFYIQTKKGSKLDLGNTAVATLCLQLLGHSKTPEARRGTKALNEADLVWDKPPSWAMSVWYYITQVKFHQGGGEWRNWNEKFARAYTRNQNDDGSWTSPAKKGSDIPWGFEQFFGDAFSTAMSALTLQVYYRFLPTYKPIEVEEEVETESEDVVIEII